MIGRLFGFGRPHPGDQLYHLLVARARAPAFFGRAGVPDSVEGRLELLMLHVGLLVHRTAGAAAASRRLAKRLTNRLFDEIEVALREESLGDKGLQRRLAGFGQAFYGRLAAYAPAIDARDRPALEAAIRRNVLAGAAGDAALIAESLLTLAEALDGVPVDGLVGALSTFAPEIGAARPTLVTET